MQNKDITEQAPQDLEVDRWVAKINSLAREMDATAASTHPSSWDESLRQMREQYARLAANHPREVVIGTEYDFDYIKNNPIATVCPNCKRREPINAPSLENVNCFWCWSPLKPADPKSYQDRIANLWRHTANQQLALTF